MSELTNRYKLPYLIPSQAQKHVTHNEAIRLIDGITNLNLNGIDQNSPPAEPQEGVAYTIGNEPTGQWINNAGSIGTFVDGAWMFTEPFQGLRAFDQTSGKLLVFDTGDWKIVSGNSEVTQKLGINTTADEINKLAVKSDVALFTTDDEHANPTGDLRIVLNKTASGDSNSLLFQTGYSGRIEIGCTGSDNFQVKVSADGNNFNSALEIDAANGNIGIGKTPSYTLDIERGDEGQITRSQIRNTKTTAGSGAALNVSSGNQLTQFLQYSAGAAYLVSSSNTFYLQTTGASPNIRFFVGSVNAASLSSQNASFQVPLKLPGFTKSTLPSAATSGVGSVVFVSDDTTGALVAFSDGTNWRRCTDRQIVS